MTVQNNLDASLRLWTTTQILCFTH